MPNVAAPTTLPAATAGQQGNTGQMQGGVVSTQGQQAPGKPGQKPGQPPLVPPKKNPNSTQNTLQIAEVRDGIAIMNDGTYRAIVSARSINFDLMSAQEREAVEYAYQNFLNSLYFPIQIVVRSRKVDMRPYLERLGKMKNEQDNMLLSLLMDDYIYYVSQLVEQTNIMSKQFYIVIPYTNEVSAGQVAGQAKGMLSAFGTTSQKARLVINEDALVKAKTEIQNRVQSVINGLMQVGVQATPLETQAIIELYYDVYNPDTATRQPLVTMDKLASVVVTKGEGDARDNTDIRGVE
jgi:hypothetical protein